MASAPLAGGGGADKHRWSESKVYTRKSFNKSKPTPDLNPPTSIPPLSSSTQTLTAAAADDALSSLHPPPPPPPASDDDSSNLNPNSGRRHVTISLTSKPSRELRRKLTAELDLVRSLVRKLEAKQIQLSSAANPTTPTSSAAAAAAAPALRRHLSVGVPDSISGEKEKRTPKANQYYRNSDFLLGKDKLKLPPSDHGHHGHHHHHKKSKKPPSELYARAFKSCASLLSRLMKHKHGWVFNTPVDAKALGLHDYFIVIKKPMDLGTVKSRLSKNWYRTPEEFAEDVRLTFRNAMTYNPKGQDVHVMAEQLLQIFEERWPAIDAEYSYKSCLPSPPQVVSKRLVPPPPLDMRMVLERSDSTVQPLTAESRMKPVSVPTPHVGRPPALKKPKAKDLHKRDMTFEEKQKLSGHLQNLPPEKLDNIVQIIKKRSSSLSQHDDEIEVDIDSVDTETLWELDRFVTNYKKSLSKYKRKAELAVLARTEAEVLPRQEKEEERIPDPVAAELPKGSKTVNDEKDVASPSPVRGEKADNASRSSSSSASSSGTGSSSSDSDSESSSAYGSDAAHSPRT